jgi:hypothetical protein
LNFISAPIKIQKDFSTFNFLIFFNQTPLLFCLSCLCRFTTHLLDHIWGPDPLQGPRCPPSMFFTLMAGASGSSVLASLRGARRRCFLALIVGALGSSALAPPRGPAVDIFYIDGGCSRISVSTSQGGHRRRFLALMVDAPRTPAPTPPRGPTVSIFYIDGGRS